MAVVKQKLRKPELTASAWLSAVCVGLTMLMVLNDVLGIAIHNTGPTYLVCTLLAGLSSAGAIGFGFQVALELSQAHAVAVAEQLKARPASLPQTQAEGVSDDSRS